jgi:hypothetical protein
VLKKARDGVKRKWLKRQTIEIMGIEFELQVRITEKLRKEVDSDVDC